MWISVLCLSTLLMVNVVQIQAAEPMSALSTDNPDVQKRIVDAINKHRREVEPTASNMVEVKWNEEAAANALKWAKTCSFVHSKSPQRKISTCDCGENLYMASYAASWEEALKAFDDEKKLFTFGKGKNNADDVVGHYTQLVWYNSHWVGCAYASCPGGKYTNFYVCQQCPPGNIQGSENTPYKKGDKCGDCPKNCNNGLCTNPCTHTNVYGNCNTMLDSCNNNAIVKSGCKASCNCKTEII